jgi:hypothetical protein
MSQLRERRKEETSGVASEPGVASTSRAAQVMDIDTENEQSTQSQTESTQYSTRSLRNSHNSTFVIHSFCYLCNKRILIHKSFISFHISTCIKLFHAKKLRKYLQNTAHTIFSAARRDSVAVSQI